jgi:hypothetical protein
MAMKSPIEIAEDNFSRVDFLPPDFFAILSSNPDPN